MGWIFLAQFRVKNLRYHAGQDFKKEELSSRYSFSGNSQVISNLYMCRKSFISGTM